MEMHDVSMMRVALKLAYLWQEQRSESEAGGKDVTFRMKITLCDVKHVTTAACLTL